MKKLIVPAVVIVMAVTSAFSTGDTSKKLAVVPGFVKHNVPGTNCEQEDDCSDIDTGTLCYINQDSAQTQLWIMNTNGECLKKGYRPE
ncbi:DUF6520 family protein [Flavobacterium sp. SM2513]|uniref:DUF6520 family protein n=1 Tax=Flavobacterium sp. SM2513 TaxID=3424766 RepID=UPI003D7F70BC